MRRNGLEFHQSDFRLDINKDFFMERVIKHWYRLSRAVVGSPSLEAFKERVDVAPGDTGSARCGAGAGLMVALDVVQPQQFCDSIKRVWVFFLMVEKEIQIKTLHWVPGKLRLPRQFSAFVLSTAKLHHSGESGTLTLLCF